MRRLLILLCYLTIPQAYADHLYYSHDLLVNIHADYIGGAYPKYKLTWGDDGTANDVSLLNPLPVQGSFTPTQPTVSSVTTTNITTVANSSVTLASSNPLRKGMIIFDQSATSCFIALNATASDTQFAFMLFPLQNYTMDNTIYTGAISAYCTNNGNILITEY